MCLGEYSLPARAAGPAAPATIAAGRRGVPGLGHCQFAAQALVPTGPARYRASDLSGADNLSFKCDERCKIEALKPDVAAAEAGSVNALFVQIKRLW